MPQTSPGVTRAAAGTGAALGVACVSMAVAVAAAAAVGHGPQANGDAARGVVAGLAFGGLGGLVTVRRPGLAVGWLMLVTGLSNATFSVADTWASIALVSRPGALPGGEWAYWVASWSWSPGYQLPVTLLLLLFPNGRVPSARWRPVAWLAGAVVVLTALGWALTPYQRQDIAPAPAFAGVDHPLPVPGAELVLTAALPAFVLTTALSLGSLAVRWRHADRDERGRLRWVLAGAVATVVLLAAAFTPSVSLPGLIALAMLPLPATITVAVLRRGLWHLDVLLGHGLVYAGLTLAILASYAVLVAAAGSVLGDLGDGQRLAALVAVAVAAHPLHARLQRLANRLLYADRDEPWTAVSRLAERLEHASHDALPVVAETVTRALRLPWAAIDAPGREPVEHGVPTGREVALPLVHQGREVGTLRVAPRAGETALAPREQRLLEQLARHAAVATHAAALQRDLQQSREHLVLAREEERRRLRRDLHDGLGPTLSAAAMKLEAADDLLEAEPAAARAMLARASETLRGSVAEVRRIVDDLRPPSLDGLGLAGALREKLEQFAGGDLQVELRVDPRLDGAPAMPAAVDVAAYRIVSEAVTNAVRHASASRIEVTLGLVDHHLRVEVSDDGTGLPGDTEAGVGLGSMHERAAELGGTCTLDSGPDGTRVVALLPWGQR